MIAQQDIPQTTELFTAYLGSTGVASATQSSSSAGSTSTPSTGNATSFYTFGYIDKDATEGQEVTYTPVDSSQGFWSFASASAQVGDKTVTRTGNTAIADTGTTLALVGDDLCQAVYGAIPGAKINNQQQVCSPSLNCPLPFLPFVLRLNPILSRAGSSPPAPTSPRCPRSRSPSATPSSPSIRRSCPSRTSATAPTTAASNRAASRASTSWATSSCARSTPSSTRATSASVRRSGRRRSTNRRLRRLRRRRRRRSLREARLRRAEIIGIGSRMCWMKE